MTLDDYFADVMRVVDNFGLDFDAGSEMAKLRPGDERRGRIRGRISLTDRTFLAVSEQIEMRDGKPVRLSYAYYLIIDGIEVWAHDHDPAKDPAIHRHSRRHERRSPDTERALEEMLEKGWKTAENEDFWAYSDEVEEDD